MPPPKPISVTATSQPYEIRSNYQQAQIQELTEQCEALRRQATKDSRAISDLEMELETQRQEAQSSSRNSAEKWKAERKEMKHGQEKLKRLARIAELDAGAAASDVKWEELRWREALRQEAIAVLARDYKITAFQIMEQETEREITALEVSDHILSARDRSSYIVE